MRKRYHSKPKTSFAKMRSKTKRTSPKRKHRRRRKATLDVKGKAKTDRLFLLQNGRLKYFNRRRSMNNIRDVMTP